MSDETKERNHDQEKGGKKCIIVVVIVLIIGIAAVCIWFLAGPGKNGGTDDEEQRPFVITEENAKELTQPIDRSGPSSYEVTMSTTTWLFEDGQSPSSNAYVENSKDNTTAVYFDIVRNDTKETIYQSPVLPVDSHLDNIILDKDLEAGDYECTMTYYLVDDSQKVLSTLDMWLMIKVAN